MTVRSHKQTFQMPQIENGKSRKNNKSQDVAVRQLEGDKREKEIVLVYSACWLLSALASFGSSNYFGKALKIYLPLQLLIGFRFPLENRTPESDRPISSPPRV